MFTPTPQIKNRLLGKKAMLLLVALGFSLGMLLLQRTAQEIPRGAGAQQPRDLSQDIAVLHEGDISGILSLAGNDAELLLGGAARTTTFTFIPKIASFKRGFLTDLSDQLQGFTGASVETIAREGNSWLIGGGDPFFQGSSPRMNLYDGNQFIDQSNLLQSYQGSLEAAASNGTAWLLGINGAPQGGEEGYGESDNTVLLFDGMAVTEVVSATESAFLNGALITDIASNGAYWLIAYRTLPFGEPVPLHGPFKSRLLKYDDQTIEQLHPEKVTTYSIFALGWNGQQWLIPIYSPISNLTTLWSYDGMKLAILPTNLPGGLVISAVTWIENGWLLASTVPQNIEGKINATITENPQLDSDAATLWSYAGAALEEIPFPNPMMLISEITYDEESNRAFLGGITKNGTVGFATYEPALAPEYPDGTLLRAPNRPEVFVIFKNKKRHVPSEDIFAGYGYRWEDIQAINQEALAIIPDVKLIRAAGDPKVYYLDRGQKRWLKNETVFSSYGLPWADVFEISALDVAAYRTARLYRRIGDSMVFYVSEQGLKRHLKNPEVFLSYGNRWEDVVEVTVPDFMAWETTDLIRRADDYRVYKILGGEKRWIENPDVFQRFGLDFGHVVIVNEPEFLAYPTGSPLQ